MYSDSKRYKADEEGCYRKNSKNGHQDEETNEHLKVFYNVVYVTKRL